MSELIISSMSCSEKSGIVDVGEVSKRLLPRDDHGIEAGEAGIEASDEGSKPLMS